MMSFKARIVDIERKLEEITLSLFGMQNVLKNKGPYTPKIELQNIVFDMQKLLDEIEKLKLDVNGLKE